MGHLLFFNIHKLQTVYNLSINIKIIVERKKNQPLLKFFFG